MKYCQKPSKTKPVHEKSLQKRLPIDRKHFDGALIAFVEHSVNESLSVHAGPALGHFNMPAPPKRFDLHPVLQDTAMNGGYQDFGNRLGWGVNRRLSIRTL